MLCKLVSCSERLKLPVVRHILAFNLISTRYLSIQLPVCRVYLVARGTECLTTERLSLQQEMLNVSC